MMVPKQNGYGMRWLNTWTVKLWVCLVIYQMIVLTRTGLLSRLLYFRFLILTSRTLTCIEWQRKIQGNITSDLKRVRERYDLDGREEILKAKSSRLLSYYFTRAVFFPCLPISQPKNPFYNNKHYSKSHQHNNLNYFKFAHIHNVPIYMHTQYGTFIFCFLLYNWAHLRGVCKHVCEYLLHSYLLSYCPSFYSCKYISMYL